MANKRTWKRIILAVVALLILIVIFGNTHEVTFWFFGLNTRMPMFLWLFLTLVIGAILGWVGNRFLRKK
jgi:uncharacterized integral membrane protein